MEYFSFFPLIFLTALDFRGPKWSTWAHCAAHPTFRKHDLCIIESPYISPKEQNLTLVGLIEQLHWRKSFRKRMVLNPCSHIC